SQLALALGVASASAASATPMRRAADMRWGESIRPYQRVACSGPCSVSTGAVALSSSPPTGRTESTIGWSPGPNLRDSPTRRSGGGWVTPSVLQHESRPLPQRYPSTSVGRWGIIYTSSPELRCARRAEQRHRRGDSSGSSREIVGRRMLPTVALLLVSLLA